MDKFTLPKCRLDSRFDCLSVRSAPDCHLCINNPVNKMAELREQFAAVIERAEQTEAGLKRAKELLIMFRDNFLGCGTFYACSECATVQCLRPIAREKYMEINAFLASPLATPPIHEREWQQRAYNLLQRLFDMIQSHESEENPRDTKDSPLAAAPEREARERVIAAARELVMAHLGKDRVRRLSAIRRANDAVQALDALEGGTDETA